MISSNWSFKNWSVFSYLPFSLNCSRVPRRIQAGLNSRLYGIHCEKKFLVCSYSDQNFATGNVTRNLFRVSWPISLVKPTWKVVRKCRQVLNCCRGFLENQFICLPLQWKYYWNLYSVRIREIFSYFFKFIAKAYRGKKIVVIFSDTDLAPSQ